MSDYQPTPSFPYERTAVLNLVSRLNLRKTAMTNPRALASLLGSTTEFAQAICTVLGTLSNDELERTPAPTIAEKILAEHNRILKEKRPWLKS
jgi:hypothetical protein